MLLTVFKGLFTFGRIYSGSVILSAFLFTVFSVQRLAFGLFWCVVQQGWTFSGYSVVDFLVLRWFWTVVVGVKRGKGRCLARQLHVYLLTNVVYM